MLRFSSNDISALKSQSFSELAQKIDLWLENDLDVWRDRDFSDRRAWLDRVLEIGAQSNLHSHSDYALFARILVDHDAGWQIFIETDEVTAVLRCERRPPGAKIRELSRLSSAKLRKPAVGDL